MNPGVEGKAYPRTKLAVDPDRVDRFAAVVGQTVAGVPPTFATIAEFSVFGQIVADPELGLDFDRVVHGNQEFVVHRPFRMGEILDVSPRIAAIRERGDTGFLTIEVELTSDGEPVATARATMVERTATP